MDTLFPVILSVPHEKQQLRGRERVAYLSRLARSAVECSSQKTGTPIGCLQKDDKGVPIPSGGIHWSVSHKPEYVIGVVSPEKIGIVIEKFRPYSPGLEKKVADRQEWGLLKSDRSELLFRYWTAKEAVLNSEGMGLSGLSACKVLKVIDQTNLIVSFQNQNRVIEVVLSPNCSARIKEFDFYFEELEIKGRSSMGNQVTKYPIKTVNFKEAGWATLAGRKLWFDDKFGRLNTESKGQYLGSFEEEKVLVLYEDGSYELRDTELTQRFEPEKIILIEKFDPEKVITAVYLDNEKPQFNIKRFKIETTTLKTQFLFIKEGKGNRLETATTYENPILTVHSGKGTQIRKAKFKVANMVEVMGWKAVGAKLTDFNKSIEMEREHRPKEENTAPELFG